MEDRMPRRNGQPDNVRTHPPDRPDATPSAPAMPPRRYRRPPEVVAAPVPATVWTPPARAVGPGRAAWVQNQVRRAFLPPGGTWWDMTPTLTDRADPARGSTPPPFWAALIDPTPGATSVASSATQRTTAGEAGTGDPHLRESAGDAENTAAAPHTSPQQTDVVFADLTEGAFVDGRLGM